MFKVDSQATVFKHIWYPVTGCVQWELEESGKSTSYKISDFFSCACFHCNLGPIKFWSCCFSTVVEESLGYFLWICTPSITRQWQQDSHTVNHQLFNCNFRGGSPSANPWCFSVFSFWIWCLLHYRGFFLLQYLSSGLIPTYSIAYPSACFLTAASTSCMYSTVIDHCNQHWPHFIVNTTA